MPGTEFETLGQTFDFYGDQPVTISEVLMPKERMAKELFYIPALVLLLLVIMMQRRRQTKPAFFGNIFKSAS